MLPVLTLTADFFPEDAGRPESDRRNGTAPVQQEPTIRLHLWLEAGDEVFFGAGRALLLSKIEEHGSLSKAAEDMGMSYRAAWGKIRRTEKVLGLKLIERNGCKKGGHRLTEHGLFLTKRYLLWFNEVERWASVKARELFPWTVKSYKEKVRNPAFKLLVAFSVSLSPMETLIEAVM